MKKKDINKKIKKLEQRQYDAGEKINKDHDKLVHAANEFRMKCVEEVFKLMHKDKELKKLNKMWEKL